MRTRIKICCIGSPEEVQLAIRAGADALGLVARMPSGPGTLADEDIARLSALTPPPIATFLLTAEVTATSISQHIHATRPTTVQIVSHIEPAEAAHLAAIEPQVRRVQVIHIEGPDALELIPVYAPHVHAFLLDSGRPSAAVPELGGTGRCHDWSISRRFVELSPHPVFLAGGLCASNVAEAIERVQPFGLDLCSGVRTNGKLDADKLRDFMACARNADEQRLRAT